MNDAYCFHKSFDPAGPAPFQMDRHYLLYALEGTLRLEAGGKRWTLPPARAALIAANEPITLSILTRLTSASVLFAPGYMPAPKTALSVFDMTPLARALIAECRDWGADAAPLTPYATQIFRALAEVALALADTPSRCSLPVPKSDALAKALDLTEARATGAVSFDQIASETGQSPRALARRFSEELGMTWSEALRRIRIIMAVEALADGNAPVTQIALSVGYNSLSAFNASFRDLMEMTPTQFRASLRT